MNILDRDNRNYEFDKFLLPKFPQNMLIEVTNACNHQCIFCENRKMTRKRGFIKKDFLFRILQEAYELGTKEVGYYATGEPFMCNDLSEYIKKAKNIGYKYVYITTNGALATKDKIKEVIDAGLDSIKFSINAGNKETYKIIHGRDDFDLVLENLQYAYEYRKASGLNYKIFVSFVRTNQNFEELNLLKNLVLQYIDEIVFFDVYNQGGNMYEINDYLLLEKNYRPIKAPCYMLFNRFHITYEGYLNICCVDFENYLAVADLNKTSLKEAWHCENFINIRKRHIENNIEDSMCYNCINNSNNKIKPLVYKYASIYEKNYEKDLKIIRKRLKINED